MGYSTVAKFLATIGYATRVLGFNWPSWVRRRAISVWRRKRGGRNLKPDMRPFSEDEVIYLEETVCNGDRNQLDRVLAGSFLLMIFWAMRWSDLMQLKKSDLLKARAAPVKTKTTSGRVEW